jgi:ubiquitin C-terminal hydrolase
LDDDGYELVTGEPPGSPGTPPAVAQPAVPVGAFGLVNIGNTCYMNAALQGLLVSPTLIRLCGQVDLGALMSSDPLVAPSVELVWALVELVRASLDGCTGPLTPGAFWEAMAALDRDLADRNEQHDPQQCLGVVLNAVMDGLGARAREPECGLFLEDRKYLPYYTCSLE